MKAYKAPQVIIHQPVVFEKHSKPSGRPKPPNLPKPPFWPPWLPWPLGRR